MRNTIFIAVALFLSTQAYSMTCETNGGYYACVSESSLDAIVRAANSSDYRTGQGLIDQGQCLALNSGLRVTKLRGGGWGVTKFMFQGVVTMWTVTEAVTCR